MVELKCPACAFVHWEIDHDYRGMFGGYFGYSRREYSCPQCNRRGSRYKLMRRSPSAFFLQPHDLYPMSPRKFAEWFALFREHFPDDHLLGSLGVSWYPGVQRPAHQAKLSRICSLGPVDDYWLRLSNRTPTDRRPSVCVQRDGGEAHFWLDPIELEVWCASFERSQIERVQQIVALKEVAIRTAWNHFNEFALSAQQECLAELERLIASTR